jgi:TonB-linked SusC/RagA family outer membrane protein
MKKNSFLYFPLKGKSGKILLRMKLTLLLLLAGLVQVSAISYSQATELSLDMKGTQVAEVLREIESISDFRFFYQREQVDVERMVTIRVKEQTIEEILEKLFTGDQIEHKIYADKLILIAPREVLEVAAEKSLQPTPVTGTVTDENGEPIIGATVMVKGSSIGTITDVNGKFSLANVPEDGVLVFSFVGMRTQEVNVSGMTLLDIIMEHEAIELEELVVIGYGTIKKRDLTGAMENLSSDKFNKGNVISVNELIQGRAAGINITQVGGEPGAVATVRVRGVSSIRSGNEPLYVIDGIPLLANSEARVSGGSDNTGPPPTKDPLNFINPNDIESIDILKDASATAIYGSRGSNGVVLITTKKGKTGKVTLNYSFTYGISNLPKKLGVLSADGYRAWMNDSIANGTSGMNLKSRFDEGANTDWQDQVYRTAHSVNHDFSFSGGSASTAYRASLAYNKVEGILKNTSSEKYTGRFNITHKALNDRLTIESNVALTNINDERAQTAQTGWSHTEPTGVIQQSLMMNPTTPIYDADGKLLMFGSRRRNPVAQLEYIDYRVQTFRAMGDISAGFKILDGLEYKFVAGFDHQSSQAKTNMDVLADWVRKVGNASIDNNSFVTQTINNLLTYNKTFGSHSVNLMAGHEYQKFTDSYAGVYTNNHQFNFWPYTSNLGGGGLFNPPGSGLSTSYLQSFFGRVNYVLAQKYLLTATVRRDGSSKFANNKYGTFPSVALAWKLDEENFIKNLNLFSELKVRASWGQTGNQEVPEGESVLRLEASTSMNGYFVYGGQFMPALIIATSANPDLKWETNEQIDAGIDFGVLKGRLTGTLDYYKRTTKDAILPVATAGLAPTAWGYKNLPGTISNTGFEVSLNGILIGTKDLSWSVNGNISLLHNEVSGINVNGEEISQPVGEGLNSTITAAGMLQIIENGYGVNDFYGATFLGFDSEGRSTFADKSGNPILWDVANMKISHLGSPLPTYTYGFGTSVRYKDLDFSLNFNGLGGNKVYNLTANAMSMTQNLTLGDNILTDYINSGQSVEESSVYYSSRFIEDGSFLRLSNATCGYTVKTASLTNNYINSIRVFVTGTNLMLFTKYKGFDPEVNTSARSVRVPIHTYGIDVCQYPRSRTFLFGVNVQF